MFSNGLGQLKAYIDADEGVAFEMDNELIWDSWGVTHEYAIRGVSVKKESCKFWITTVPSGKVMMSDCSGMYLATTPSREDPNIYPVRPVPDPPGDINFFFEVFYRKNKIALKAYNGLFLARVHRCFHTIVAAKAVADENCFFRPMIGDLYLPIFKTKKVSLVDLSRQFYTTIKMETFVNKSNRPRTRTFSMTWETTVTDRVSWTHLWGLGIAHSRQIRIHGMRAKLIYTEDNDAIVSVTRHILENQRKEVVVPPRSTCTVCLLAKMCENAVLSFTAIIRKVKSNGDVVTIREKGAWSGLVYHGIHLLVTIEQNSGRSIIM